MAGCSAPPPPLLPLSPTLQWNTACLLKVLKRFPLHNQVRVFSSRNNYRIFSCFSSINSFFLPPALVHTHPNCWRFRRRSVRGALFSPCQSSPPQQSSEREFTNNYWKKTWIFLTVVVSLGVITLNSAEVRKKEKEKKRNQVGYFQDGCITSSYNYNNSDCLLLLFFLAAGVSSVLTTRYSHRKNKTCCCLKKETFVDFRLKQSLAVNEWETIAVVFIQK